jgi:hypothetical protein
VVLRPKTPLFSTNIKLIFKWLIWSDKGGDKYIKTKNFLGVGGHKIFRDDIWGRLRMIWQADHRYFKRHGKYDFPQKAYGFRIATALMMLLTRIPGFRKKFYNNLRDMPIRRMQRFIEKY